jgi:hypothetical protein
VLQQALQPDLQHHLARTGRPAEAAFGRLQPFEETANAQDDVTQAGAERLHRGGDPLASGARSLGEARIGAEAAAVSARGQEPVPVLAHARAHLRAFEILAQAFARLYQVGRQERLAIRALAARQRCQRRFREVHAHPAAPPVVIGDAGLAEFGVLRLKARRGLGEAIRRFCAGGPRPAAVSAPPCLPA